MFNWMFLHPGTNGLILAQRADTSEELFSKAKMFWEHWPFRDFYHLKYSTKQNMHWQETGSRLKIATAGNRVSGRGHTVHAAHLSEVAFYPDPKTLMLGLRQSIPHKHGSLIVLESTANGIGNFFYEEWNKAETGESEYIPLFFPWFKHPEYAMPTTLCTDTELSAEEKELRRLGASYENIHWRRWALINLVTDISQFMQEYPATADEAFRTTGNPVFSPTHLRHVFHDPAKCTCRGGMKGDLIEKPNGAIEFIPDPYGRLTIYKAPSRRDKNPMRYFLGADPSMTIYGDPAAMQVINRSTNEQVAVWSGHLEPQQLAAEVTKLGYYYNGCTVCPEVEGGGQTVIATILERGYPLVWKHRWADKAQGKLHETYGWLTSYQRKRWAVGMLQSMIASESVFIHDRETYNQLRDYSYYPGGELGNGDITDHDDQVSALMIAVTASHTEGPYLPDHMITRDSNSIVDIFTHMDFPDEKRDELAI